VGRVPSKIKNLKGLFGGREPREERGRALRKKYLKRKGGESEEGGRRVKREERGGRGAWGVAREEGEGASTGCHKGGEGQRFEMRGGSLGSKKEVRS